MNERRPPDPSILDVRDWPPESRTARARAELDRDVETTSLGEADVRDDLDIPIGTVAGPGGGYVDPAEAGVRPDLDHLAGRATGGRAAGGGPRARGFGGTEDPEGRGSERKSGPEGTRGWTDDRSLTSPAAGDRPDVDREAPNEGEPDPEGTGRYRTSDDANGDPGE